ncbi:MAG: T9SS type A sorting domain-containing protein [Hymenobacter sp.]|nr:MAG: T9SS type A sorting domain-containing protein [Hymenobacter sp.]
MAATAWQYSTGYTYAGFGLTNYTLDGTRFVIANSDAGGVGSATNTTLTSPTFSTVGYATLNVSFLHAFYPYAGVAAATVEVSTDGGLTWVVAAKYDYELGTATPVTSTVSLAAYLNQRSVQLRWHYVDVYGVYWAIDNVQFTASQPALTYAWSLVSGDGLPTATNTANLVATPTQNSVYRLSVGYAGSSCTSSSTVAVAVVPTPALVASASSICVGSTSQLSATNVPATGYTYAWALVSGNGLPATTNTAAITVSPTQNSVYRLTITNGACSTSSTIGVAAVANSIDAYPVPFGEAGLSLQVSTCTAGPAAVQIYDVVGHRVYDNIVSTPPVGITTVNLPETGRLRPGKYIVKVQQGSQNTTFNVVRQ